jgi:hypothetical protein
MELQTFITQTLIAITKGVSDAQNSSQKGPSTIVPRTPESVTGYAPNAAFTNLQNVDFDVAVTVSEGTASSAGGKITVLSAFNAGGEAKRDQNQTTATHIKFSVPIAFWPVQ